MKRIEKINRIEKMINEKHPSRRQFIRIIGEIAAYSSLIGLATHLNISCNGDEPVPLTICDEKQDNCNVGGVGGYDCPGNFRCEINPFNCLRTVDCENNVNCTTNIECGLNYHQGGSGQ